MCKNTIEHKMNAVAAITVLSLLAVHSMIAGPSLRFEDHRVEVAAVTLQRADPSTHSKAVEISEKYRTMFRDEASEGPNFAGKYRVVRWGCGSGCIEWAVVDLNSGKIYFDKDFGTLMFIPGWDFKEDYLEFKKNSSLIVAQGVANEPGLVKRYFLNWDGTKLQILATELLFDGRPTKEELEVTRQDPKSPAWLKEHAKKERKAGAFKP
jgi:hypothetical protein